MWIKGSAGPSGSLARVIVKATDVILSLVPPHEISARSVLHGRVANIQVEGPIATIEIELKDDGPLLATITKGALEDLALKPGSQVYALFKTAALDERSIDVANAWGD
ncbi:MAG: TOBE-like domain-containing protein [Methylocystis sp.]